MEILFWIFSGYDILFSPPNICVLLAVAWTTDARGCSVYMVSYIWEMDFSHAHEVSWFCLNSFIILTLANVLVHKQREPSALQKLDIILLVKSEATFKADV